MKETFTDIAGPGFSSTTTQIDMPPLEAGDFTYVSKGKSVLLIFPTGDVSEFSSVEAAAIYLDAGRRAGSPGAAQTTLFAFQDGEWRQFE